MRIDNNIYLSSSISKNHIIKNKWCIMLNQTFQDFNIKKDLIKINHYIYQLRIEANALKDIILSSNQCSNDQVTNNLRLQYPQKQSHYYNRQMFNFKLKF
ncbi:hypothetical protein ABPG72_013338 [Tetrahymena utriculariae]